MSAAETYLRELGAALQVRGRARRRLLVESRDHLADASSVHGVEEAIRQFGPSADLARAFDAEIAVRRGLRATAVSVAGVLGVGFSAWALLNAADPGASAAVVWAVVFFGCAQTSAVAAVLASVRAAAMRHEPAAPAEVALLCRRNLVAVVSAAATLFAAGAAVPGHTSAWKVLLGPSLALLAAIHVTRARSLARRLDAVSPRVVRAPFADLLLAIRRSRSASSSARGSGSIALLGPTVVIAAIAAFVWDRLDQGTVSTSGAAAGIEAALTLAGFALLGPALGLRVSRTRRTGGA